MSIPGIVLKAGLGLARGNLGVALGLCGTQTTVAFYEFVGVRINELGGSVGVINKVRPKAVNLVS